MFLAIAGVLFPFIKGFLGENVIEKVTAQKRLQLESANELEKAKLNADIKAGEQELERKKIIRDLQLREYEHPFLWWPKFLIMMAVALYWFAKFMHKTFGLADFNVAISDLTTAEEVVSSLVMGYMFVGNKIERVFTGRQK